MILLGNHVISRIKLIIRCSLPGWASEKLVVCKDWIITFAIGIKFISLNLPVPKTILFFGVALGDDLLCTAVLRELRNSGRDRLLMISNYRELFIGNDDAQYIRPAGSPQSINRIYSNLAKFWGGDFRMPLYGQFDGKDQSEPPSHHIIVDMCANAGIVGPISIRPYFRLTEQEKSRAAWAAGRIVIQSSGMGGILPIRNKEWFADRFQGVVDALRDEYEFVQLGSSTDPALDHVEGLQGRTSIRESGSILHHARVYIGTVGFLMHLARAVECPAVIVYGGREAPWQSGYVCNFNLYSALPCAPCWRWNSCEFDRKCMSDISVNDVVSAIHKMMKQPRGPLAVETVDIMPQSGHALSISGAAAGES
jgi:hypothetical protein